MPSPLTFRPLTLADAQCLLDIYSDKAAMKYRGSKPMERLADAQAYISDQRLQEGTLLTVREGVMLEDSHVLIGSVMYRYDGTKPEACEIGYSIGRQFWGKGYGHAILKEMLAVAQKRADIKFLTAECHKENIASIKVLAKAEFEHIGQTENLAISIYRKQNHPV